MFKPFKFLIHFVVLEVDEDGTPIGEKTTEQPVVLYGAQAAHDFIDQVVADLKQQEAE